MKAVALWRIGRTLRKLQRGLNLFLEAVKSDG
jgi:hypothetical protein